MIVTWPFTDVITQNKLLSNLKDRERCGPSCHIKLVNIGQSPEIKQDSDGLTYWKQQNVLETSYDDAMSDTVRSFQKENALTGPYIYDTSGIIKRFLILRQPVSMWSSSVSY
jgi:hypothetical protein